MLFTPDDGEPHVIVVRLDDHVWTLVRRSTVVLPLPDTWDWSRSRAGDFVSTQCKRGPCSAYRSAEWPRTFARRPAN